jgi:hypothetical protein
MTKAREPEKADGAQQRRLDEALEMTFPASDPPELTEPGAGVTGPEARRSGSAPAPGRRRRHPAK